MSPALGTHAAVQGRRAAEVQGMVGGSQPSAVSFPRPPCAVPESNRPEVQMVADTLIAKDQVQVCTQAGCAPQQCHCVCIVWGKKPGWDVLLPFPPSEPHWGP